MLYAGKIDNESTNGRSMLEAWTYSIRSWEFSNKCYIVIYMRRWLQVISLLTHALTHYIIHHKRQDQKCWIYTNNPYQAMLPQHMLEWNWSAFQANTLLASSHSKKYDLYIIISRCTSELSRFLILLPSSSLAYGKYLQVLPWHDISEYLLFCISQ